MSPDMQPIRRAPKQVCGPFQDARRITSPQLDRALPGEQAKVLQVQRIVVAAWKQLLTLVAHRMQNML